MQEEERDKQETQEDVTIPQMIEDVRVGKMARLVFAEDLWGHNFRAFEFPARNDDGT